MKELINSRLAFESALAEHIPGIRWDTLDYSTLHAIARALTYTNEQRETNHILAEYAGRYIDAYRAYTHN